MKYNMLNKSELKITNIHLEKTNLTCVAKCVAHTFAIPEDKVLVIDVRNGEVALDILSDEIDPHSFVGKEKVLLGEIAKIPGVQLSANSHITSEGMLGWIAFETESEQQVNESIAVAEQMAADVVAKVAKRVLVYPSGTEVENGEIEDTNTPALIDALTEAGYTAEAGDILKDDEYHITNKLMEGIYHGYGTIITTGGVGAEDKDHSVEAVLRIDPEAAVPYIVKFRQGHGRHVKDGIKICVGKMDHVTMITLPGPNDEVRACIPKVIEGLDKGWGKELFAEKIANVLRSRLNDKMHRHKRDE